MMHETAFNRASAARLDCAGESLFLLPERAAFWPARSTLFIADLHLGKAAAFRAAGIPVPERVQLRDLERLSAAIAATKAERLIVLGDLVHARSGLTAGVDAAMGGPTGWRRRHKQLDVMLVTGNHDRSAGRLPERWRIRAVPPGERLGPFVLVHDPAEAASEATVGESEAAGGAGGMGEAGAACPPEVAEVDPGKLRRLGVSATGGGSARADATRIGGSTGRRGMSDTAAGGGRAGGGGEPGGYALAGHLHPAVRLEDAATRTSLRLPAFVFGERCAVLPAFSTFTGCARVRPRAGDRVFVVCEDTVLRVASRA